MRVITLNVNGLRSAERRGFFDWLPRQDADVVCLQEIKICEDQLTPRMQRPGRFRGFFHCSRRRGYAGVAVYARREPDRVVTGLGWGDADAEGRYLQADFGDLSIVSLYVPSGTSGPERLAWKFRFMDYLLPVLRSKAREGREYLLCGDWNIAHRPIDLRNWRANQKYSGFLPEERAWLDRVFGDTGWVDTYRRLYPEHGGEAYTWWSNRGRAWEKNVGWRIDYHVATPGIAARAQGARVYKRKRFSDHAPLIVEYDHRLAESR
ncbi:MAG: exodeoxyribonuclease III [Planctomycetota bacterium]|nr:MAG: exodeoxyribonuclease III [Planctomycetota bacterium]